MPLDWLYGWMMIGLRSLGVAVLLPTPGGRPLPAVLRVALAVLMGTVLVGVVPRAPMPPDGAWGLIAVAVAREVTLGLALGFVGRTVFAAAELAGRLIANELGLTAAPGFDVPTPAQEPLPSFIAAFAALMFFLIGGHQGAIAAFARSFDLAPAGAASFGPRAAEALVHATAYVIELGLRIAAPFIALNFVITLAFSILGRAVPRMNVFIASYPVRTMIGLSLLAGAGGLIGRYVWTAADGLPWRMLDLVARS